jgi:hypothetical protein
MQGIRYAAVALAAALLISSSCDDNPPTGSGGSVTTSDRFPGSIGMLWKYQIYDSLTRFTDTLWLSITDTSTGSSGENYLEVRQRSARRHQYDWQYFRFVGDTLDILNHNIAAQSSERFIFPLKVGSIWTGPEGAGDSSVIETTGTVVVPAGSFGRGVRIDRAWNRDFEGGGSWSSTWVVPDVGVVSRYFLTQFWDGSEATVTRNETWKLIGYDLATFNMSQFPHSPDDLWRYEQLDSTFFGAGSLSVSRDTIIVIAARTSQLPDGREFSLQEVVRGLEIDTQYVIFDSNFVRIQADSLAGGPEDIYFQFPLAVGRYWGVGPAQHASYAVDKEQILTAAGIFEACFHTSAFGGSFEQAWTEDDWLAPGIGIVRSTRRTTTYIEQIRSTRLLIDYKLNRH